MPEAITTGVTSSQILAGFESLAKFSWSNFNAAVKKAYAARFGDLSADLVAVDDLIGLLAQVANDFGVLPGGMLTVDLIQAAPTMISALITLSHLGADPTASPENGGFPPAPTGGKSGRPADYSNE
jgi:hypothetical protein